MRNATLTKHFTKTWSQNGMESNVANKKEKTPHPCSFTCWDEMLQTYVKDDGLQCILMEMRHSFSHDIDAI
jgi:hypothetical protein